jgi:hypothetical protein
VLLEETVERLTDYVFVDAARADPSLVIVVRVDPFVAYS